jgi:hypothetical protein
MPPPDHGFRGPRQVSAPNRNFFRFTVVNCATHRVTQHGVSFLQFEELLTAKARKAILGCDLGVFRFLFLAFVGKLNVESIPTDRYSKSSLSFRRASELALAR